MTFSIVPPHLAVKAMRDNGYKNAAYALAELMDNSIQAGASVVELLCGEIDVMLDHRSRSRVQQIAVLDNGNGMESDVLRMALQFGNGTHLDSENQKGIGRFGMGLPASSISQCKRVDVWSWKNGHENAIYSYLDIDKIANREMTEVPEPEQKSLPEVWCKVSQSLGSSGTLVVWSTLDRLMWKTAPTIIENSEFVIGRMYRKFLESGRVKIRMVGFDLNNPNQVKEEKLASPNDPSYLMGNTSCPAPFDQTPMFDKWGGEDFEVTHVISFEGKEHEVKVRYSVAKEEARQGVNPGNKPHGKHAAKNVGASIIRADRELELDPAWASPSDPRERWWGIEVDFSPSLDTLFGVTNNKQHAHNFAELAKLNFDDLLKGGLTISQLKDELRTDEDPRAPLLELGHQIHKTLHVLRALLRAQTASEERSAKKRHEDVSKSPEAQATEVTHKRQEDGHSGQSDKDENLPPDERQGIIEQTLIEEGLPESVARELAASTVSNGLKYVFAEADLETSAFFSVKQRGGSIIITLNTNHPAYPCLVEVLEKETNEGDGESYENSVSNALNGLKLLLMAWARYEDEQPDGNRRIQAQETRSDWGRLARQFLERNP
jgi:hypothetical protein